MLVTAFEAEGDQSAFPTFTRGFTRALIIALTRFTALRVFGAETALRSPADVDPGAARCELAPDYLVTGQTSLATDRFEVDVILVEAASGRAVWAESYQRRLLPSAIIALRNDVANRVARALAQPYGAIQADRARDADGQAPEMLGSYAAVLLFYAYWRTFDRAMIEAVRVGLERAVADEPDYAEALACLSLVYSNAFRFRHPVDAPELDLRERALELAARAVELAPSSSWARYALGLARWFAGDPAAAIEALEAGRALNPNDTTILADLGQRYAMLGRWDEAVPLLEESYATNPAQPGSYRIGLFLWHYAHGRFAEALAEARRVNAPQVLYGHVAVAAAAAELGLADEAADAVSAIRGIDPDYGAHVAADLEGRHVAPALVPPSSPASPGRPHGRGAVRVRPRMPPCARAGSSSRPGPPTSSSGSPSSASSLGGRSSSSARSCRSSSGRCCSPSRSTRPTLGSPAASAIAAGSPPPSLRWSRSRPCSARSACSPPASPSSVQWLAAGLQSGTLKIPPPPAGVADWPVVGEEVDEAWTLAAGNLDEAVHRYGPAVLPAGSTVLGKVAAIGADVLKFVVSVVIAGFLFLPGPRLAAGARAFASRLIAPRGAHFVDLAGATIRNVSRGVIGVALIQALLAGIVLYVAGIPGAGLIAFVILLLCIVQIGPAPILLPLLIWIWMTHADDLLAGPHPPPRPRRAHRQRAEADPDGPRPDHADARHPDRRDRRHADARPHRPLPRPGRAVGLLRARRRLDPPRRCGRGPAPVEEAEVADAE